MAVVGGLRGAESVPKFQFTAKSKIDLKDFGPPKKLTTAKLALNKHKSPTLGLLFDMKEKNTIIGISWRS